MRRAVVVLACGALLAACGDEDDAGSGSGSETRDFAAWSKRASAVCTSFVARTKTMKGDEPIRGTDDADVLRRLARSIEPVERLQRELARDTAAIPLPRERAADARAYVDLLDRRAANFTAMREAAARADEPETRRLTELDGDIGNQLAAATRRAGVGCG